MFEVHNFIQTLKNNVFCEAVFNDNKTCDTHITCKYRKAELGYSFITFALNWF